ncbi:hypothetical protein KP509_19G044400 [Ceratopteris richardii]|nr:hypothetical protein KP509_19G044400 [Ceratopteris richardii]
MDLTLGRPSHILQNDEYMHPCTSIVPEPQNATKYIQAYLRSLIDERKKIEAFKRELPICMQLLSNEIEASRMKICDCVHGEFCKKHGSAGCFGYSRSDSPLPKADFIISKILDSLPKEDSDSPSSLNGDAALTSAISPCLHAEEANTSGDQEEVSNLQSMLYNTKGIKSCNEDQRCPSHSIATAKGGDFVPYLMNKQDVSLNPFQRTSASALDNHQEIAISMNRSSSVVTEIEESISSEQRSDRFPLHSPCQGFQLSSGISKSFSPHRKQRRCWAAELHRKFIDALQQLGGAEVATPKQIREIMQVDGLTNDEVKSHLQKYRLHMRKPNSAIPFVHFPTVIVQPQVGGTPQLVVLGGIWMP